MSHFKKIKTSHFYFKETQKLFLICLITFLSSACSEPVSKQEEAKREKTGLFTVFANGRYGLMDYTGNIVLSPQYDKIGLFQHGLCYYQKEGKYGLINKEGKRITEASYDYIPAISEDLILIMMGGQYGYMDHEGNIKINSQYSTASAFKEGYATVSSNGKFGVIDREGQWLIQPNYEWLGMLSEGMIPVRMGNKRGYLNEKGDLEINPQFDQASDFKDGIAIVKLGYKEGIINQEGKYLVNPQFDDIDELPYVKDKFKVKVGSQYGIIDAQGNYAINPQFDRIYGVGDDLFVVQQNNMSGLVNAQGEYVLDLFAGRTIGDYLGDEKFIVSLGGNMGILNTANEYVIQPFLERLAKPVEGLFRARQNNNWGYLDDEGNWKINAQFTDARDFDKGKAWVEVGGSWGLIDSEGEWIINPQFSKVENFFDGLAWVVKADQTNGYVNAAGEEVGEFFSMFTLPPQATISMLDQAYPGWKYAEMGGNESFFGSGNNLEPYYLKADFDKNGLKDEAVRISNGQHARNTRIAVFLNQGAGLYDVYNLEGAEFLGLVNPGERMMGKYFRNGGISTGAFEAGDGPEIYDFAYGRFQARVWTRRIYSKIKTIQAGQHSMPDQAASQSDLQKGQKLTSWVDQLNVRATPTMDGEVVYKMKENEAAEYLGEKTPEKITIRLRGKEFTEPWLKVKMADGSEGWLFGGAVKLN